MENKDVGISYIYSTEFSFHITRINLVILKTRDKKSTLIFFIILFILKEYNVTNVTDYDIL